MTVTNRNPQEAKAECLAQMGPDLGEVFYSLTNDLTWLHAKWQQYRGLFGVSEERLELINRSAGAFFWVVQETLWDEMLLHISRLTDPSVTMGKNNLSFSALLSHLDNDAPLRSELEVRISECTSRAKFARDHRNKRIAHRDMLHALDQVAHPLGGVSRQDIEDILEAFRRVMAPLYLKYWNTTMFYEDVVLNGDVDSLLVVLTRAEKFKKLLVSGKVPLVEDED